MSSFNWFIPGQLAGSGKPGLLADLADDLAAVRGHGISVLVTLTEAPLQVPDSFAALERLHFPIDDMHTPQPRECARICGTIAARLRDGKRVLLHCKAGLGRTGLMAAAMHVTLGQEPGAAVLAVRALNRLYIQTAAQENFVHVYSAYLHQTAAAPAVPDPKPDPAFYQAIGGDGAVRRILFTFYERVFSDPVIGHFFARTDKETLRGKQAAFMRRAFLGAAAEQYMGQRPRNAHHAMVISDAQFDHRQELMRATLVDHGLTPPQVAKWLAVEGAFRRQIVKDVPQPLFYNGVQVYWASTATTERLEVATLCDRCAGEVLAGEPLHMVGDQALCTSCAGSGLALHG